MFLFFKQSLKGLHDDSFIKPVAEEIEANDNDFASTLKPINEVAQKCIKGGPIIKQYLILNDKRFIITKDSNDNVAVYDVLKAKEVEFLGKVNFDDAVKSRQKFISIPNWFTVDLKLGVCIFTDLLN